MKNIQWKKEEEVRLFLFFFSVQQHVETTINLFFIPISHSFLAFLSLLYTVSYFRWTTTLTGFLDFRAVIEHLPTEKILCDL
jgi:hypothetical protein